MEYWDGNAQLHDFVYAGADTSSTDFRSKLSSFFEDYRKAKDREGRYLMAAEYPIRCGEPLTDPAEMRQSKAAQMRLIEARVLEAASSKTWWKR